jgi:hypothetical protein
MIQTAEIDKAIRAYEAQTYLLAQAAAAADMSARCTYEAHTWRSGTDARTYLLDDARRWATAHHTLLELWRATWAEAQ